VAAAAVQNEQILASEETLNMQTDAGQDLTQTPATQELSMAPDAASTEQDGLLEEDSQPELDEDSVPQEQTQELGREFVFDLSGKGSYNQDISPREADNG
jgi:hypothetical protein